MNKYLFYPGCSMQRSARPYLDSLMAIRPDIGMELEDVEDWNCCGATEYGAVYQVASHALVGRNLAKAAQQVAQGSNGHNTVVAGCSACYLNLAKTDYTMREDPTLTGQVNAALGTAGLNYEPGSLEVRHLLDVVYHDVGLEAIKERVVNPLTGLRVAPYYGCMVVRPDSDNRFGNPEYPTALDKVLKALGAEVIDFPMKSHCCGGHMTQISPQVAYEMIHRLISGADQYRADMMVTLCPMCQLNLDAYQGDMNKHMHTDYHVPVLYFTQLMGLAFGHKPDELGLGKEFVSAADALSRIGVQVEEETPAPPRRPRRKKKDDPSLPMPQMGAGSDNDEESS